MSSEALKHKNTWNLPVDGGDDVITSTVNREQQSGQEHALFSIYVHVKEKVSFPKTVKQLWLAMVSTAFFYERCLGLGVQGWGCRVGGAGLGVRGWGCRVGGAGLGVGWGCRVGVQGWGSGCRVGGAGFGVQGQSHPSQLSPILQSL